MSSPRNLSAGRPVEGRGYNMQVYSGKPFFPLDPDPAEIDIEDIAHALSLQCRFNGHCNRFYSVAQHSWLMSLWIEPEFALEALLHDAAEAYVGDVIRPLKMMLPDYKKFEAKVEAAIREKFSLPAKMSDPVKHADIRMVWTEKRDLLNPSIDVDWGPPVEPYPDLIVPIGPIASETSFLARFQELTGAIPLEKQLDRFGS